MVLPPKPPKTVEEQLQILKDRGLTVGNEEQALLTLQSLNYYRLRGYYIHLCNGDAFHAGTTFEQIVALHSFDAELRVLLLALLLDVEVIARTRIAYVLGHAWQAMGYKDTANYNDRDWCVPDLLNRIKNEIKRSKERFIAVHNDKYGGQFPIWVVVEMMSFGNLSKLYSLLPTSLQRDISTYYGIHHELLEKRLHSATVLRNLCAHNCRIYERTISIQVAFSKAETALLKKFFPTDRIYPNTLFSYLLVLRSIIPAAQWNSFLSGLTLLFSKYRGKFAFRYLGFPEYWINVLGNKST